MGGIECISYCLTHTKSIKNSKTSGAASDATPDLLTGADAAPSDGRARGRKKSSSGLLSFIRKKGRGDAAASGAAGGAGADEADAATATAATGAHRIAPGSPASVESSFARPCLLTQDTLSAIERLLRFCSWIDASGKKGAFHSSAQPHPQPQSSASLETLPGAPKGAAGPAVPGSVAPSIAAAAVSPDESSIQGTWNTNSHLDPALAGKRTLFNDVFFHLLLNLQLWMREVTPPLH